MRKKDGSNAKGQQGNCRHIAGLAQKEQFKDGRLRRKERSEAARKEGDAGKGVHGTTNQKSIILFYKTLHANKLRPCPGSSQP